MAALGFLVGAHTSSGFMSKQYLAILNPAAGGGRCAQRAAPSIRQLSDGGIDLRIVETTHPGHATTLVRRAWQEGQQDFIAIGGDGTTYELLNGLFPLAAQDGPTPCIGLIPVGSGNSFVRDFSSNGLAYATEAITAGKQRRCDVLRLVHRDGELYFINLLSMGFVADVAALRNRRLDSVGEAGYIISTVVEVARLRCRRFNISVDSGSEDTQPLAFVSFNNSRFTGGKMMMAPHADPQDGKLDYVRAGQLGRLDLLLTFPRIFSGTHIEHPLISTRKVDRLDFDLDAEVDVMVDGEVLSVVPRRLDVLPGVVRIMV